MFFRIPFTSGAATRSAALILAACAAAGSSSAMAVTLIDNLALAGLGWNNGVGFAQHVAVRVPAGAASSSVTEVTLLVSDQSSIGSLVVRVCDDGAGGTQPGATCSPFAALDPLPNAALGPVRFSGHHAAPAGGHIWVVANGTVPGGGPGNPGSDFRWGTAAGTGGTYISSDSGLTWALDNTTALLRVTATPAVAGPAVGIPVLGLPGLVALSLGVGAAGAGLARRRARRARSGPSPSL